MALPYAIAAGQTDARSPVDDNLMDSIRLDLEYLDGALTGGGSPVYVWNINGPLRFSSIVKRVDMQFLHSAQSFSRVRLAQEKSGSSGVTEIDIRYHTNPKTPITGIAHQLQLSTTSIGQLGSALATQSISIATPAIATQSISMAKAALNVQSIINVGTNLWRYNLNTAPDADYMVGDSVLLAGCTAGGNNGTFTVVEVNQSGHPSIVVSNASGVAQTGAAGTLTLQCFSYNYVNPINANIVAGEQIIMTSHTTGTNNGTFTVYSVNNGGNNIWIKKATGAVQAGAAGTATCTRWVYTYASAVNNTFYVVGEKCRMASHTTGANNGDFFIRAVNSGGNNIIITNASGVAQAGVAGNANTLRWKYTFGSDPSANVSIGDTMVMASHSNANNNGTFIVVLINDTTSNNIIVYNALGVVQAGAAGTVTSSRKIISFSSDQSLIYSTDSYVELKGCVDTSYNMVNYLAPFKVKQVNRGGGSNYNIVIENASGGVQASPVGYVAIEAKSIFTAVDGSKPQIAAVLTGLVADDALKANYSGSSISSTVVPDNTYLGLYILQSQLGTPENLSVILS